jgi:prophage tail gpP-like protein
MPSSIDTTVESELVVSWDRLGADAAEFAPRVLQSWSVDSDFFVSTDGFELTFYDDDRTRLLDLELEPVTLLLGEASILIGRTEVSTFDSLSSQVTIRGRDYISDLVECAIDPSFTIKKDERLDAVIRRAASPVGISFVLDDGDASLRNARTGTSVNAGAPKTFTALRMSDLKPQPGQGIYDFLNRLCARHGTTIQPAVVRDSITLQAPNYDQDAVGSISRASSSAAANRNIITGASATRDYTSFPTYTLFTGKQSLSGGGTEDRKSFATVADYVTAAGIPSLQVALAGKTADGRIMPGSTGDKSLLYRLLYFRDEAARNQEQLDRSASRAIGERLKQTLVYEVTVNGHRDPDTGVYWAPDTIVYVNDDVCGVTEKMWVASRTFSYSAGEGATTKMRMFRPGAITL